MKRQKANLTVVQAGFLTFVGALLLCLFATLFVGLTVYPTHWFLHWPQAERVGRALFGSFAIAAVLSAIIMAGKALGYQISKLRRS